MKLVIAVEGYENLLIQEPDLPNEVSAFVAKLIQSRTRGPQPRVLVMQVRENNVVVDADQLIKLQSKATALRWIVECDDSEIVLAVENAKKLVKGDSR